MIYLFAGDDSKRKIINYEKFIASLDAGIEIFSFNKNNFERLQVESFYSGVGLFFNQCVVVFQNILEREENRDFILEKLSLMSNSNNVFIFLEGKLTKIILDEFKKARTEINIFELPKEKLEKYDNFLLANAYSAHDKLNLWIHFRKAMDLGVGMEELVGVLFWKAKDMLLRKNYGKFKEEEIKNFAMKLSYLLPEARKRGLDDEATFEQFLLEAF